MLAAIALRSLSPCTRGWVTLILAVASLVFGRTAHAQEQTLEEMEWVGKQVIPAQAGFSLRNGEAPVELQHRVLVYKVEKVNGPWLWLVADDVEGWAQPSQVVAEDKALDVLTEAIRANPNDAYAFAMRGFAWRELRKDLDVALGDYDEAIRLDPASVEARLGRGAIYRSKRDYDRAMADYDEAIRLDSNSPTAHAERAWLWRLKQDLDKAMADYSEAIRRDPRNSTLYNYRGIAWDLKGETDKAIADYSTAIRLNPKNAHAYGNRGRDRLSRGEYDRGIADFEIALRLDPKNLVNVSGRAEGYRKKGDFEKALTELNDAIKSHPEAASLFSDRASVWLEKRDFAKANEDFDRCVQLSPQDAVSLFNRAVGRQCAGKISLSLADLSRAIRLTPKEKDYVAARSETYLALGEYDRARADCDTYLRLTDDAGWKKGEGILLALLAHAAARLAKKDQDCERYLRLCEEKSPPDNPLMPYVRYLRGQIQEDELLDGVSGDWTTHAVRLLLGLDRELKGKRDEAIEHYQFVKENARPSTWQCRMVLIRLDFLEHGVKTAEKKP